jgi:putative ubiquitin-RnfH superfamily antitoxin RatB of RatAB toxin-antitoxin module
MGPADAVFEGEGGVSASLGVEVVFSPAPRQILRIKLSLRPGSTVSDAVAAAVSRWGLGEAALRATSFAVWGRKAEGSQAMRAADRLEILRALQVDPKEARRLRYRRQGERGRARRPGQRGDTVRSTLP